MRVVIDTCVWVAAIRSRRGASFALLSEISHGRFRFGISVPLFLEYRDRMQNAVATGVTELTMEQGEAILAALAHYGVEVPVYFTLRPNLRDENDNMVFECAANFGAEAIITHNVRDFAHPELKGYGIEIFKPGEFLRRIRRQT
jgi:putative PIN family toxin of toxin-antitoxin system